MAISDPQPAEITAEVVEADAGEGGGGCPDLRTDILGGGSVGPIIQVEYVGDYTAHWEGVGPIPPHCGPQDGRETPSESGEWSVDTPPTGGHNDRSETVGDEDLCIPQPKHGRKVHFYQNHYELVSGRWSGDRGKVHPSGGGNRMGWMRKGGGRRLRRQKRLR